MRFTYSILYPEPVHNRAKWGVHHLLRTGYCQPVHRQITPGLGEWWPGI